MTPREKKCLCATVVLVIATVLIVIAIARGAGGRGGGRVVVHDSAHGMLRATASRAAIGAESTTPALLDAPLVEDTDALLRALSGPLRDSMVYGHEGGDIAKRAAAHARRAAEPKTASGRSGPSEAGGAPQGDIAGWGSRPGGTRGPWQRSRPGNLRTPTHASLDGAPPAAPAPPPHMGHAIAIEARFDKDERKIAEALEKMAKIQADGQRTKNGESGGKKLRKSICCIRAQQATVEVCRAVAKCFSLLRSFLSLYRSSPSSLLLGLAPSSSFASSDHGRRSPW